MAVQHAEMAGTTFQRFKFRAMNTDIEIACWCTEDRQASLQLEAVAWFQAVEARFSRFLATSEFSRLNRASGDRCLVSSALVEVLQLAEMYRHETNGVFDPLILEALTGAGYDETFDAVKRREQPKPLAEASAPAGDRRPDIDPGMRAVRLPRGTRADLGGIVKSWAVRRLASQMRYAYKSPCGMIDAGGDLTVWTGQSVGLGKWQIGIENPWQPDDDIATLTLAEGAAATSSKLGRQWRSSSGRMHHLIDPRTMRPSDSDTVQCTVTGPDIVACEIWAKTICILGSEEGAALFRKQAPAYTALLFTAQGGVRRSGSEDAELELKRPAQNGCLDDHLTVGSGTQLP